MNVVRILSLCLKFSLNRKDISLRLSSEIYLECNLGECSCLFQCNFVHETSISIGERYTGEGGHVYISACSKNTGAEFTQIPCTMPDP